MNGANLSEDPPEPAAAEEAEPADDDAAGRTTDLASQERPRRNRILVGAVVAVLSLVTAADAFVMWRNWDDWTGCFEADDRVIDERSGLCYDLPPNWRVSSADELEAEFDGPGRPVETSGLELDVEYPPHVYASTGTETYLSGSDDLSLTELAEVMAQGSQGMQSGDEPEIESSAVTVDGCEAATATARLELGDGPEGYVAWARVTVVDVGDGLSSFYSAAVVESHTLNDEDGTVAVMDAVHDSLSVV
jgi:hypothetical protein